MLEKQVCLQRNISTSQQAFMSEILCRNGCQKGMNGIKKDVVSIENSNQTRHLKGIIIEGRVT